MTTKKICCPNCKGFNIQAEIDGFIDIHPTTKKRNGCTIEELNEDVQSLDYVIGSYWRCKDCDTDSDSVNFW